jgi:anaphase-promoting complex subunit 8
LVNSYIFISSTFIDFGCFFHLDYEEAEQIYEKVMKTDEFRLEGMDVFSHILYVLDNKAKLSVLAHKAHLIDRFRPEACCIIGSFFLFSSFDLFY